MAQKTVRQGLGAISEVNMGRMIMILEICEFGRYVMSQNFLFAKIHDSVENRAIWISGFWEIAKNPGFEPETNRHMCGSTGRQIAFWARIRIKWLILRILCPGNFFVKNA